MGEERKLENGWCRNCGNIAPPHHEGPLRVDGTTWQCPICGLAEEIEPDVPLSADELAEGLKLLGLSTLSQWRIRAFRREGYCAAVEAEREWDIGCNTIGHFERDEDAALVVWMHNHGEAVLRELMALREQLDHVKKNAARIQQVAIEANDRFEGLAGPIMQAFIGHEYDPAEDVSDLFYALDHIRDDLEHIDEPFVLSFNASSIHEH